MPRPAADPSTRPAGLLRRLLAALYDALILLALWMLAAALWLLASGGEAPPPGYLPFQGYLALVALAFFCGFWVGHGRTLGMQSWRLRLVDAATGGHPSPTQALVRFLGAVLAWAPAGLGVFWMLLDRERLTVQDRLSGTRVVVEAKRGKD